MPTMRNYLAMMFVFMQGEDDLYHLQNRSEALDNFQYVPFPFRHLYVIFRVPTYLIAMI